MHDAYLKRVVLQRVYPGAEVREFEEPLQLLFVVELRVKKALEVGRELRVVPVAPREAVLLPLAHAQFPVVLPLD